MPAPHSHLQTELGHTLGDSLLADALLQWRPPSTTLQRNLVEETLSHARAVSNVLTNLLEQRAVVTDEGGGPDLCDSWDLFGLSDLLSSLLEITTIVSRRNCPEHIDEPEATTDRLWLAGGDGSGCWADATVRDWPAPPMTGGEVRHG